MQLGELEEFMALIDLADEVLSHQKVSRLLEGLRMANRAGAAELAEASDLDPDAITDFLEGLTALRECKALTIDLRLQRSEQT